MVNVDANMFETALRNIISNAVKYTNQNGTIDIRIKNDGGSTTISIADNGIGMSKKVMANLFQFNKPVQLTGTRGEKSSGIGLMLIKEFLDKNNATVHVTSAPEVGTTFTVTVPD
jgi:signal transduction histidine kinase